MHMKGKLVNSVHSSQSSTQFAADCCIGQRLKITGANGKSTTRCDG